MARFIHFAYPGRDDGYREQATCVRHCDYVWMEGDPEFKKQGVRELALSDADGAGLDVYCMRVRTFKDFAHVCFLARSEDEALARLTLIEVLG